MELNHTAARAGKLSGFLRNELRLSSGLMNRLKWQNALLVNGMPARTNHPVQPGDRITVILDEPAPEYPAEPIPLAIRYEDEFLLAVDKPAGMLTHPSAHRNTGTLANAVAWYYRQTGQPCAFHPATRLDRDTFGLVLLAKNSHVHDLLVRQHAEGALEKTYEALVFGRMPLPEGTIDAPIARLPKPSLLRQVAPEGQPCRTDYRVLREDAGWSHTALRPRTGRTHQLRVHCAWLGCPILGDPQYGSPASLALSRDLGFETQQLCTTRLRLPHPCTGAPLDLRSGMALQIPVEGDTEHDRKAL